MAEARARSLKQIIASRFLHLSKPQLQYYERVVTLAQEDKFAAARALLPELKSSLSPEDYQKLQDFIASLESNTTTFEEGLNTLFSIDDDSDSDDDTGLCIHRVTVLVPSPCKVWFILEKTNFCFIIHIKNVKKIVYN